MARTKTGALIISWEGTLAGREAKQFEVFGRVMAFAGEMKERGVIHDFQMFIPLAGTLGDMLMIFGDVPRLAELLVSDEFEALVLEGQLVCDNLRVSLSSGGAPEAMTGSFGLHFEKLQEHGLLGEAPITS